MREKRTLAKLASTLTVATAALSTNGDRSGEKERVERGGVERGVAILTIVGVVAVGG